MSAPAGPTQERDPQRAQERGPRPAQERDARPAQAQDVDPSMDHASRTRDVVYEGALARGLPKRLAEQVAQFAPRRLRRSGGLLVACDLDRTLMYSARALALPGQDADAPRLVVAEVYRGEPISFYTRDAELMLTAIAETAELVPVTTRTRAQYARLRLPVPPRYAIAVNGGHILVEGVVDRDWSTQVAARLASGCTPLPEIVDHLARISDPLWLRTRRVAEDLFAYLVVEREMLPATLVSDLSGWCAVRGWSVSLQGRKVYCVPDPLTKSAAVAEVAGRCDVTRVVAAGDSLLDADMLAGADEAVRPAHGELHEIGWQSPNLSVTERSGVLGGQEISARLLALALAVSPTV